MAAFHHGADDEERVSDQPDPSEEVPLPRFLGRDNRPQRAGGLRHEQLPRSDGDSAESGSAQRQHGEARGGLRRQVEFMSPNVSESYSGSGSSDPWTDPQQDPWSNYMVANEREENWSLAGSEPEQWEQWSNSNWSYSSNASNRSGWQDRNYDNWSEYGSNSGKWDGSSHYSGSSGWHSDHWGRGHGYLSHRERHEDGDGRVQRWEDLGGDDYGHQRGKDAYGAPMEKWLNWEDCGGDDEVGQQQSTSDALELATPASPQAWQARDPYNKPSGQVPSGNPSVAGNSNSQNAGTTGKLSSSYPPIFYARPGESWEDYWRSVGFWIASEGRALPAEMRGPRMMQQLRERASKIVQHLTVEEVSGPDGVDIIKRTIEASPIIKILDQKKVDKRRQKFLRLQRLPQESIESFLNRAEIYRKENQSSPEYQVGTKFYIGHLLDAARFTKRDLALIKAASGGTLEDEASVTNSMIDLADQLEGQSGCPIGKGEPTLDQEDKYLVQKASSATSSTAPSSDGGYRGNFRKKPYRKFPRRKIRDTLMAILEEEDGPEEGENEIEWMAMQLQEGMGEDSVDEDEEDGMTSFSNPMSASAPNSEQSVLVATSNSSTSADPSNTIMEIYAQEYKARQRVREIKKMRQYFQKGTGKGRARDPAAQKWIEEQQKTEPCFLCHKLGHWSQECPYRNSKQQVPHSTNVTFPSTVSQRSEWDLLEELADCRAYMEHAEPQMGPSSYLPKSNFMVSNSPKVNEVCWSIEEMKNMMIVDLGCMKTVAGTDWVNPLVKQLKQRGKYIKVEPENESFRFGDGHLSHSKYSVLMEVTLATIPCILRVSVVSGNCPPLLSKHVATALGFIIDTQKHVLSSHKYHVKAFGLQQTSTGTALGGHYILAVNEMPSTQVSIPVDLHVPKHVEVYPLIPVGIPKGAQTRFQPSQANDSSEAHGNKEDIEANFGDGGQQHGMGAGRDGRGRRARVIGRRGAVQEQAQERGEQEQEDSIAEEAEAYHSRAGGPSGSEQFQPDEYGTDGTDVAGDEGTRHATRVAGGRGHGIREQDQDRQGYPGGQGEEEVGKTPGTSSLDRQQGGFPNPVDRVQRRRDLQRHGESSQSESGVQMETLAAYDEGEGGRGGSGRQPKKEVEKEPTLGDAHARKAFGSTVGTSRSGKAAMLEPQDVLAGDDRDGAGEGASEEGLLKPSDPNAPTVREQERRGRDRVDLVMASSSKELQHGGDEGDGREQGDPGGLSGSESDAPEVFVQDDSGQGELPGEGKRITLNRRQRRSILQGVKRGIQTHKRIYEVAAAQPHQWTLLEVFAGCANLSKVAKDRSKWNVMPPQDVKYGLDLAKEEHQEWLKDLIRQQEPDVVTLSPPCGPWSTWQRMRKRKGVLRELRKQHMPFWRLVVWIWAFQTARGGLVVLEQPQQSEALKLNVMHERKAVWQKNIHLCGLGLKDRVSGKPHKKPTAIQMNHPVIQEFPEVVCNHQIGQHQPIEGSVRVEQDGKMMTMKRSTLAGEWTPKFCAWLLEGLERAMEEAAHTCHIAMTDPAPINRIWETVPVEVEDTMEGQLRQQMALHDYDSKYDYISFAGTAALLNKKMRSSLAHLHVALGHISNDKLARMLAQNGAKESILDAAKQLKCQVCLQVQSPQATPKAAFNRPMGFNERLVSDTFYVWDTNGEKFAVTHLMDAFSMYMVATVSKDAAASATVGLLRDKWFSIFGPPATLMTDQGPEYCGVVEQLLRTFAVFHDMVPPTAHWRMALAERHGAVIKLLLMKIVKEVTASGLDDMQTAATSAVAARNRQTRVGGFSPIQLVFGKDTSIPSHLMEALAGQFKFQLSNPTSVEDAFRRSADMRKAATDAFQWLETNEALRRAAGSRARLPRLELLTEGAQVMFWEPPPHRRGMAKRLQDQISWVGPAVVAAVERKDGSIKRVWVRYRHKLKGLPLEYIRLAVPEEQEASTVVAEALQDLEKQLQEGRVNAEDTPQAGLDAPERPDIPTKIDPNCPEVDLSDSMEDEMPTEQNIKAATSVLDDVPFTIYQKQKASRGSTATSSQPPQKKLKTRQEPSKMTFEEKRDVYEKASRQLHNHLTSMKNKLERHKPPPSESDYSEVLHTAHGGRERQPSAREMGIINEENTLAEPRQNLSEAESWESEELVGTSPPFVESQDFTEEMAELNQEKMRWALLASLKDVTEYVDPIEDSNHRRMEPMNPARSETARQEGISVSNPRLLPEGVVGRISALPATPMTRATTPPPLHLKNLLPWAPPQFLRRLQEQEQQSIIELQQQQPPPDADYWIYYPQASELIRVHVQPRTLMFDPFVLDRSDPIYQHVMQKQMPIVKGDDGPIDETWFTGVRNTQLIYLHNPVTSYRAASSTYPLLRFNYVDVERHTTGLHDWVVDNVFWKGWNTRQHMGTKWQGVTRFEVRAPSDMLTTPLATWMEARHFAEELWRHGQKQVRWYQTCIVDTCWLQTEAAQPVAEIFNMSVPEWQRYWTNATEELVRSQSEVAELFYNFANAVAIETPKPHSQYRGISELTLKHNEIEDVAKLETGKLRLEMKWNDLSPLWQKAFEQPILDAIQIYFTHDAIRPVAQDEVISRSEILPSRFVLVNKADPRNVHPTDEQLEDAKLKARWIIAGHRDQRAGEYETESPTASLLGHNLLCMFATQWGWPMMFADVSAAFLQGDVLPEERRVFVQCPKNYPLFVRNFLRTLIPADCQTDLFRLRKAGFGLAESPRLWYKKFKRDIESIGGQEWRLMPGMFSFFNHKNEVYAMMAVHVDDVRLIVQQEQEQSLIEKLNGLFSFGEWKKPKEWTRFCGRYERQFDNGVVQLQMNEYAKRLMDPPVRTSGNKEAALMPNEKKWIGTICGQLNWMARQCRADLTFGVSRIQQLAGVNDPAALIELKILVDRAREETMVNFRKLRCPVEKAVVIGASDASFASMPRGRSQGGYVVMIANPEVLNGEAPVNVLSYHSGLIKRVVRSSLAAEISQAATTLEETDFVRAVLAEAMYKDFALQNWLSYVARWRQILVMDSRTGYDLLNGASLGEDRRLAIDIAAMKQALQEDGGSRLIRWVPGEELPADDLTKLRGNHRLLQVMKMGLWALKDTETAKQLRADAAARKRTYRQRITRQRDEAETARRA